MSVQDIRYLIRVFGRDAKIIDVINVLRFIIDMGNKLRNKGSE
jgi:tetrahydromethanopterin S-methyltransferase subunit F